jgi:hypothetical protein
MIKYLYRISIAVCLFLLTNGCSKDSFFDLVIGGQPTFEDSHPFVAGINIFAVIRPDSIDAKSMNVINIEKVIPAVSNADDSTTLTDFNAVIYKINNNIIIDSLSFIFSYPDTTFTHQPSDFKPLPGNHFKISCKSTGLPVLTAETVIPNQPVILNDIIYIDTNNIQFSILADSTAFLYDIYLFVGSNQYYQRILRAKSGNTSIEIDANFLGMVDKKLLIYAYDKNLSEYFTAPNLFIKPNTYRPPFSNVQNGYGCFGSLNLLSKKL